MQCSVAICRTASRSIMDCSASVSLVKTNSTIYFKIKMFLNIDSFVDFPSNVSYVHIRNATLETFNASEVRWRMLKSLAITDGKINRVKGQFLMMTPTLCLNLSNNALVEVENNSFTRLAHLTTLDLSYNNITHLPALNIMNGREFWLDISGTSTLLCHDIDQFINRTGEKQINFNRENETACSTSKTWHWFNTTEKFPLKQVRYLSLVSKSSILLNNLNKNLKFFYNF